MTRQGFERMTGTTVTEAQYEMIEKVYFAAGEMSAEEFCREWTAVGNSRIVFLLAREVERTHRVMKANIDIWEVREAIADARRAREAKLKPIPVPVKRRWFGRKGKKYAVEQSMRDFVPE